jgi:hypothetical protein
MADHVGSCHCGAIQYQVSMPIKRVSNCHCNTCRGMNGGAFSSYAIVRESHFSLQGAPAVYQVTDNLAKHFCPACGTPLFNTNRLYPGARMLYLGSLREHHGLQPSFNLYCESLLPWVLHLGDIPRYARGLKD